MSSCSFSCRGFIGVVSQPSTFSSLELGYVCTQDGRCLPVQEVDLPLWKHGEGGKDPKDFGFRFKADNVWHNIQVGKEIKHIHTIYDVRLAQARSLKELIGFR